MLEIVKEKEKHSGDQKDIWRNLQITNRANLFALHNLNED